MYPRSSYNSCTSWLMVTIQYRLYMANWSMADAIAYNMISIMHNSTSLNFVIDFNTKYV